MKYLLFLAAVVLYYTQVIHANPYTFVHQSGGGGSKTVRTTTFSTVKSSGRFGDRNDDDDDGKISYSGMVIAGHGVDDDDDKKGCDHGKGRGDADDDDDHKKVIIAGHNGKTTKTTTVVNSSYGKIGKADDDDDDKKGCSHGKGHGHDDDDDDKKGSSHGKGRGDADDDDDHKKVIIAGHNGKTTKTTTVVNSSYGKIGKADDDDDDKKGCSHGKGHGHDDDDDNHKKVIIAGPNAQSTTTTYVIKAGDGTQKWPSEWHLGNSERKDDTDTDCKICQGHGHDDDHNGNNKKVKVTTGHNGQTTTTTTTYVIKGGGADASQKWHSEWHIGNSDRKDDDDKDQGNNKCDAILIELQAAKAEIELLKKQISNQETEHNAQILVFKSVIQKWTVDYTTLENKVNVIIAESKSWQSKFEVASVTLTQVQQVNIQLQINLKETQTTVITLQKNVEQIKTSCKNNDKDVIEWKHKYEVLLIESDTYKKQVKELTNSITDTKKVIKEITEKLNSCENHGNQLSIEVINIKNISEVIKKNMATCELDKIKLNEALNIQINEYNADELRDHEELLLRKKIEADFNHCEAQVIEMEKKLKTEKTNVLNCRNEINIIRKESTTIMLNHENELKKIQNAMDEFKASLKIEIDFKNSCIIENKKYLLQITDIEYQLTESRKAVIEAQSQTKLCHDDANNLKISIEVFKRNIAETTNLLKKCGDSTTSIQIDLTSCQSNNEKCLRDLLGVKESLSKSEKRVTQLETENSSLEAGKKICEGVLSTLRCDINKQFAVDRKIISPAVEKALLAKSVIDKNKALIKEFVSTHNLTCVKPK